MGRKTAVPVLGRVEKVADSWGVVWVGIQGKPQSFGWVLLSGALRSGLSWACCPVLIAALVR